MIKDPYETKYQFLICKQENANLKDFNDFKAFYCVYKQDGWYLWRYSRVKSK